MKENKSCYKEKRERKNYSSLREAKLPPPFYGFNNKAPLQSPSACLMGHPLGM